MQFQQSNSLFATISTSELTQMILQEIIAAQIETTALTKFQTKEPSDSEDATQFLSRIVQEGLQMGCFDHVSWPGVTQEEQRVAHPSLGLGFALYAPDISRSIAR